MQLYSETPGGRQHPGHSRCKVKEQCSCRSHIVRIEVPLPNPRGGCVWGPGKTPVCVS